MCEMQVFLDENEHLGIVAVYAISLFIHDIGDSAEQTFTVNTGARGSEVLACNTGNGREPLFVDPPVLKRTCHCGEDGFSQERLHLKKRGKEKRKRGGPINFPVSFLKHWQANCYICLLVFYYFILCERQKI